MKISLKDTLNTIIPSSKFNWSIFSFNFVIIQKAWSQYE
mgnify:CR=1 FL=1